MGAEDDEASEAEGENAATGAAETEDDAAGAVQHAEAENAAAGAAQEPAPAPMTNWHVWTAEVSSHCICVIATSAD